MMFSFMTAITRLIIYKKTGFSFVIFTFQMSIVWKQIHNMTCSAVKEASSGREIETSNICMDDWTD